MLPNQSPEPTAVGASVVGSGDWLGGMASCLQ